MRSVSALTIREREVVAAMGRGWSNAEMLAVRDRVQAVVTAYDAGLVRPGER
ncbi:MAG: hypothetical protein ACRDPO_37780 [Streptosporangiaceae bacterium]